MGRHFELSPIAGLQHIHTTDNNPCDNIQLFPLLFCNERGSTGLDTTLWKSHSFIENPRRRSRHGRKAYFLACMHFQDHSISELEGG